jgi:hypothetical protein
MLAGRVPSFLPPAKTVAAEAAIKRSTIRFLIFMYFLLLHIYLMIIRSELAAADTSCPIALVDFLLSVPLAYLHAKKSPINDCFGSLLQAADSDRSATIGTTLFIIYY